MDTLTHNFRITLYEGIPKIQGTEVSVHTILHHAAQGLGPAQIVAALPSLTLADVHAAMAYAADILAEQCPELSPAQAEAGAAVDNTAEFDIDPDKILLVDDLQPNRRLMTMMFHGTEFEVSEADGGEMALAKALDEHPFLVISDIQMPGMSGYELCEAIKSNPQTSHAAVIFVTAHHRSTEHLTKGFDLGADDYLYRPFQRDELLARVRAVARLKRAEAEARRHARVAERRNRELQFLNELALAVSKTQDWEQNLPATLRKLVQLLHVEALVLFLGMFQSAGLTAHVVLAQGKHQTLSIPYAMRTAQDLQAHSRVLLTQVAAASDLALPLDDAQAEKHIHTLPLESRDRALGMLSLINKRGEDFTTSEWDVLFSASGLISAAAENAWLWQSVQRQIEDLTLLNQVGNTLTSTLDTQKILAQTTQLVQESLGAEIASLWLLDETRENLVLTIASGPGAQQVTGYHLPVGEGIVGHVVESGKAYFSFDVTLDDKYSPDLADSSAYHPQSILCVPLRIAGRVTGVVEALHSEPDQFTRSDLQLFQSFTNSVSIAVENARLFEEVQAFNQQLEHMVTERTRELEQEKDKTWAILANMADALIVLDTDFRVVIANMVAEEMLNFRLADLIGQAIPADLLDMPLWRSIETLARQDELTSSVEVDTSDPLRPDTILSIQARASKMWDEFGNVVGTVIVLRDVTALKEVERMKARFMAGVTHELKTPLAVIRTHANNLSTYYKRLSNRKRQELLQGIEKQIDLLERLIGEILDLARLDAGITLRRQNADITSLVDELVEELRPLAERKKLRLQWHKPKEPLFANVDVEQIERVVRNLIDNAIKYTESGSVGVVVVAACLGGREVVAIQVVDTGMGIPAEHIDQIFDRFYRVDPSHTIPGTGLGLAIVKEIVDAHGGQIRVGSTVGAGSTFSVTLLASDAGQG